MNPIKKLQLAEDTAKELIRLSAEQASKLVLATASTSSALLAQDIKYIKDDVTDIKIKLENHYVTQDQFEPVKKIVYGLVSIILVAVVGALIALVIRK